MKIQKTITIDLEVFLELREKKINLSETLNNYLIEFLKIKKEKAETKEEKIKEEVLKLETSILNKKKLLEDITLTKEKGQKETNEKEGVLIDF